MTVTDGTNYNETGGSSAERNADVAVIGDGLIGLSTAFELARAGAAVCLIGAARDGAASEAAAGLLAPSIGSLHDNARQFFTQSLARFPEFLAPLEEFDSSLGLIHGLIEVLTDGERARSNPDGVPLDDAALRALEPGLHAPHGAVLYPHDGAIDNVRLVNALRRAVSVEKRIQWLRNAPAKHVDLGNVGSSVSLDGGTVVEAAWVVLAAGAWSSQIDGLPRRIPVAQLKGQILALESTAIQRAIMGADVYLVPRRNEIAVGATVESAGFDIRVTDYAIDRLRAGAVTLVPELESARVLRRWAGFRPATPDMLPIIGVEPEAPRLVYACGHSKNGILLAPGTAAAVRSLVGGTPEEVDLQAFAPARFASSTG